jgi:hypothetical protein
MLILGTMLATGARGNKVRGSVAASMMFVFNSFFVSLYVFCSSISYADSFIGYWMVVYSVAGKFYESKCRGKSLNAAIASLSTQRKVSVY